jgi:hypothetical protein
LGEPPDGKNVVAANVMTSAVGSVAPLLTVVMTGAEPNPDEAQYTLGFERLQSLPELLYWLYTTKREEFKVIDFPLIKVVLAAPAAPVTRFPVVVKEVHPPELRQSAGSVVVL